AQLGLLGQPRTLTTGENHDLHRRIMAAAPARIRRAGSAAAEAHGHLMRKARTSSTARSSGTKQSAFGSPERIVAGHVPVLSAETTRSLAGGSKVLARSRMLSIGSLGRARVAWSVTSASQIGTSVMIGPGSASMGIANDGERNAPDSAEKCAS